MTRHAVVIGAGLIGTATAWYLAERGLQVSVLERRDGCGLETSYANGGLLTPSEADPWNAPGTLGRLLHWLGREDSPLLLRPRALPGMLGWGWKFLLASRKEPHLRSTRAILRLALYSQLCLNELEQQLLLEYDRLSNGTLKIFRDPKVLQESVKLADALRELGLKSRVLTNEEAVALEPRLQGIARQLVGAIHYPADASGDAYLFTRALFKRAVAAGVKFQFNTAVTGIQTRDQQIESLSTGQGPVSADSYVLAAGSYSPRLTRPLNLHLPIYPVKGYSVTLEADRDFQLRVPLVDFERKIVITPLGRRLRIAGTAEFNHYDITLNAARGANLLRHTLAVFPQLAGSMEQSKVTHWAGLRPMTCDGPPILGTSPYRNLFLNTGHGPLGWTLGAGSARCVADLVSGSAPALDLTAYSLGRFMR